MKKISAWGLCGTVLSASVGLCAAEPNGEPVLPAGFKALRDQAYIERGTPAQKLDIYYPDTPGKNVPLIVWVHGGAWSGGSKRVGQQQLWLLSKGYAVASVEYRFSQVAKFPAQLDDCKAAIRWLRANAKDYNIDPARIGVSGASAGGHLVALLGTTGDIADQASRVQAVCDLFGPSDLRKMSEHKGPDSKMDSNSEHSPESKLIGGAIPANMEKAAQASPIIHVTKDDAPFLIIHGDQDPLVPLKQSEILNDALKAAGVESTLIVLKNAGHGGRQFDDASTREKIAAFFEKHLK